VRSRRSGRECSIEVKLKSRIEFHVVIRNIRDVDAMVSFRVHLAQRVLVQKIVADDEPPLITRQRNVVRPRGRTEIKCCSKLRTSRLGNVLASDLAGLIQRMNRRLPSSVMRMSCGHPPAAIVEKSNTGSAVPRCVSSKYR